ncbi:GspE/PulE family protein [Thermodesulfobacteriota bacterium]
MKKNSNPNVLPEGVVEQEQGLLFPRSRYDYLLNQKIITMGQLKKTVAISKKIKKSLESVLISHFKVKKEDVGKSLSLFYKCPFKSFSKEVETPLELLSDLKKSFLMSDRWVPINSNEDSIEILIDNPWDIQKTDHIRTLIKTKKKIRYNVGVAEDIDAYIRLFFQKQDQQPSEDMLEGLGLFQEIAIEEETEEAEEDDLYDESSNVVVRLVNQILVTAYHRNVSDIHIEPSPISKWTRVRFRLDGVCQKYIEVPNSMTHAMLSRIKIMAGLDIAERRLPQDGKIKFKAKGISPFELRIATLPTAGGYEDAVLRVLAKAGAMKFDDMGLIERNLDLMKGIITQPYGLVLVVGPTGSGKTTTLHSALGHINKPGIKIWTAEDPVEITQEGLRQVEVKPKIGLDFARVMRAFLRADPDVIMIGEMRDYETASTGVEASLTGHLVFSTLHTNSAPETVTRLLDMGLNPLNFSDAFLGVLAQRLVRRLCLNCRKPYHPSPDEFNELVSEYGEEHFKKTGITYSPELSLYHSSGCEKCSQSGYKGRLGIHELMIGSPEIKGLIKKSAPTNNLFDQSMAEGMTTLKQDGILKSFQGLTDVREVRRVCID